MILQVYLNSSTKIIVSTTGISIHFNWKKGETKNYLLLLQAQENTKMYIEQDHDHLI